MKNLVVITIIISVLFLPIIVINSITNYIDPLTGCFITLDGNLLNGNEETIKEALKNIKSSNNREYRNICKYVNKIVEQHCLNSDPHFGYPVEISKGCYIKGSKIVYLEANENKTIETIKEREELILKYSKYSQNFWESLPK